MVSFYVMFNPRQNIFKIFSRKEDCYPPKLRANDFVDATVSVSEKEEVAAEVWAKSASIDETLRYDTYIYPEHVASKLKRIALYIERVN